MAEVIVEARCPCPASLPGVVYAGTRKDGSPHLEREVTWHPEGAFFLLPEARAAEMGKDRLVRRLDLPPDSRFARLAFATCPVPTAAEAAEAGFEFASVWHANMEGGFWRPAPQSGLGLMRGAFDARFGSAEAARDFFNEHPTATVLFVLADAQGRAAFAWRSGALLPIPTDVRRMKQ